ncbi:MAG: SWF/SNF helicase family protein [Syntrophales bacterium LBB04]|nr:SWF/SNF helicase family protein [Syntrophales bacterium LBB04]
MIRNTRSAIDIRLPRRFATTYRIEPGMAEKEIYERLTQYLKGHDLKKPLINLLLREAESSPYALKSSLLAMESGRNPQEIDHIVDLIDRLDGTSKGSMLTDILAKGAHEKVIIFTQYLKSMDYVTGLLEMTGTPYAVFRGDLSNREKEAAIQRLRNEVPVLVSTESGGEGRNIQFCNTIINFDLPWNPMRIEQRIGRLHRIGQTRDVFVFNLSVKGTIEDYILDILDNKINMFEMVIGEIEPILGYAGKDENFEEIVLEIWLKGASAEELGDGFGALGKDLVRAKKEYMRSKTLDEEIFGQDYEM